MQHDLRGRDFLTLLDFTPNEIRYLIDTARRFKQLKNDRIAHRWCEGKQVALLFEKTSTRTRCAFEVAAYDLGMNAVYLDPSGSQLGSKESIEDTAHVLASMFDAIEYRGFAHDLVETLAEASSVPVYNGLTDEFHPTQMLADFMTIYEIFGEVSGKRIAYMGDGRNNVARSLMLASAKLGAHFTLVAPEDLFPDEDFVSLVSKIAHEQGSRITLTEDVPSGLAGVDVVYTDVWVSMGEPYERWNERIEKLMPYQVNAQAMSYAADHAIFLHCLPAFHDLHTSVGKELHSRFGLEALEVSDEVFRSPASHVFQQAENRMHTIKALMYETLREEI